MQQEQSTHRVQLPSILCPQFPQSRAVYQRSDAQHLVVIRRLRNAVPGRRPYEEFREHEHPGNIGADHEHRPGEDQDAQKRRARAPPPPLGPGVTMGRHTLFLSFFHLYAFRGFSFDYMAPGLYDYPGRENCLNQEEEIRK